MSRPNISRERLFNLYAEHGTLAKVAKELGCAKATVKRYMDLYGFEYTNISRKYNVNHNFFSLANISATSMYWAGFIAANGSVSRKNGKDTANRLFINVSAKDKDHLEKFKAAIETEAPVRLVQTKVRDVTYDVARLLVSSKFVLDDLEEFNIVARKQHSYMIPAWILSSSLLHHFLRGWIDGLGGLLDGHFRTSGSLLFVKQFQQIISNIPLRNIRVDRQIIPTAKFMAKINYVEPREIKAITDWLYTDANNDYMERKKELLDNYFRHYESVAV